MDRTDDQATPDAPNAATQDDLADVLPGSSPAATEDSDTGVTADSPAAHDVPPADSSAADQGVGRKTLLDVTRAALDIGKPPKDGQDSPTKKDGQDVEGAPSTTDPESTAQASDDESSPADSKDDDFSDADSLAFGKHPRFKKLLGQWRRDRDSAGQFRQIDNFMREHEVSNTDAAAALKLAALLTHARRGSLDHAKLFLEDMGGIVAELRQLTGDEIAPDLQERLSDGALDEAAAKELTQSRRRAEAAERTAQAEAAGRQDQYRQTLVTGIKKAVSDWDAGARTRDPDFARKEALVRDRIQVIAAQEGPPRTAQAAVALAERAYAEVNEAFADMALPVQRKPAAAPANKPLGAQSLSVRKQPLSPVDITRAALQRTSG